MAVNKTPAADTSAAVTPEMIALWKKKHGDNNVFCYETDGKKCWIHRPDRKVIAFAAVKGSDPLNEKEIVIRNCWLGGDNELVAEDKYFFGFAAVMDGVLEVVQGELKKV